MKKTTFWLLLLFITTSLEAQEDKAISIDSKIEGVTIYLQGAEITRTATVKLKKGTQEYVLKELSQYIDDQSVRVKGDGEFSLMSVASNINYLNQNKMTVEIKTLEEKRIALSEEINLQKKLLLVLQEEESMILTNKSIGGQEQGVQISELTLAADFFRTRLTDIKQKELAFRIKIRNLQEELMKYSQQLMELNFKKDLPSGEIRFKISSKIEQTSKLTIKYVVDKAGWKPSYDIRVSNITEPLNLVYKAKVFQETDEDWKDVKLILSTGNPSVSSQKPSLQTWNLYFNNSRQVNYYNLNSDQKGNGYKGIVSGIVKDSDGNPLPGVTVMVKGTSIGAVSDINGAYSISTPSQNSILVFSFVGMNNIEQVAYNSPLNIIMEANLTSLDEVVVIGYGGEGNLTGRISGLKVKSKEFEKKEKKKDNSLVISEVYKRATMAEFQIELPYSILSDGEEYTVDIQSISMPAMYEYSSVPKLDKDAFLMARLVDWEDYELLNGDANLYFEGTYKGVAVLNVENTQDTLDISLGRDQDIVITRKLEKDFSQRRTFGANRKEDKSWEILIRNTKNESLTLILEDQYPISTDKDIEIEKIDHSGGVLDEKTGKVTWRLTLKPKETQKLYLKYSVKYPKNRTLIVD